MDTLRDNLHTLGVTDEETTIYLSALEHGSVTVLELARNTGIPRTTVYLLIESLLEKKLLLLSSDEKKKLYTPAPPEELIHLAQRKKEKLQETVHSLRSDLPQLQALFSLHHHKPKVSYYEGLEEVKKIFESSLQFEKIYVYLLSSGSSTYFGSYLGEYRNALRNKMRYSREILNQSIENLHYMKKENNVRNEVVLLSQQYDINIDILMYGDKLAYITYKNDLPQALVIDDKDIQYMEKIKFNLIWDTLNFKRE